ncbi:MAG: tRNA pseudouridine(13) synthase TruD [Candidatus Nitrosocaldus sp.]|nr:tRNA pseudouridine(13) synthase TruD [Candidatus Nitrosocaldus sp.]MDW7999423.1 tRNA pseudouridine(13) synthase TruD [Candidatus Nitrosocaldus sp.]
MIVPDLDRMIGLEVYSTGVEGVKGRVMRRRGNDGYHNFIVEEVIGDWASISKVRDERHRYPVYLLRKEGIDTIHALKELESTHGIRLNPLGLKDAHASTIQYVTSGSRVIGGELRTRHCTLTPIGYSDRMLRKRDLVGNRFTITMELEDDGGYGSLERIRSIVASARARRLANFYGYQRFGSMRPVTHLVGREIVRRRFRDAVELLLTYTSEYEDERSRGVRLSLRGLDLHAALEHIPYHMDMEREVAMGMLESGDPIRALRRLHIGVRRLFVEAYQAYIFNRALSMIIRDGYDISTPCNGDICFRVDEGNRGGELVRYDGCSDASRVVPAMQLAGFAFKPMGRFCRAISSVMMDEGVTAKDFYVREMQEVSVEGGFRPLPLLLLDGRFDMEADEGKGRSVRMVFALPKGSYATILLREIIKPVDPVAAGF